MKLFKSAAILFVFAAVAALCALAACGSNDKHTYTIDLVERAATCTEQGLAAHYECVGDDGCGKFFADAEGLTEITVDDIEHTDALGHIGGKAKCNALAVCTRCGDGYGEYGEHDYSGGFVKSDSGHYPSCVVCGEIKEGAELIPHEYGDSVVDEDYLKSEATCQSKPVYHKTCICGAFEENGETFTYGELGDHDYKWTSDGNNHWKECKTEGCTAAHTDEGAHIFPMAYTVTETGHYKECVCGRHTDEGEHIYTEEAKNDKYLIREPNCTQTALYHKSCVCGVFEENGDTFETGTGTHAYEWKSDETRHWQYCPVCFGETEKTEHSHDRLVVRVRQGKNFKEDETVNPEDYAVYNVCECGDETECNEAFTVVNAKYVRDENTITVKLNSDNSKTAEVTVTATALPRYKLTLVGASYNGENELQLKEGEKLPTLTVQEGKTFAGYYYDDSFKVYYNELPSDYADTHITVEKLSDFTMPAYAYKLTAMLYENMPYVVPSDYQADGTTGATGKVASHVETGGKIVTRFEWEPSQKGREYKMRPNNDTKSHNVNVANPAVNPKEGDKSLMLVGITNNGNEAVTIRYQTENWGYKGDLTVTVGAHSTVIVPFIYNFYYMDNGNNRGTCWNCDQCIAVTSDMTQKAQLDVFGYIVADGNTKPVRLDASAVMIEQGAQTARLSGNLIVDLNSGISLKVYDEVDVSTATQAHGSKYLKFSAYGQEKTVPMFTKNGRSDYNQFVLVPNDDCDWLSGEWDYSVPDTDIATKFTFKTDVTNSGQEATLASWKWNEWAKKNGYNVKVPGYDGVTRDIELRFINHSDEEIKIYVYAENNGDVGGVHITLKKSSEVPGEQVFTFTRKNIGLNYGTNYMIKMEGNASAGSSFTVYGWYKACKEDIGVGMKIKDSNQKTSFKVGDKFDSSKLRLMFDVQNNNNDNNPNIVNYVTDYDGYTFTKNDVGKHTVTVYWYGNSVTYDITVSE